MSAPNLSHSIAIDDGIKASLATLELVKYTSRNETLSNNEVESAHLSLNQVIRTAESIKEKLQSCIAPEEIDSIASNSENDEISVPPSASLLQKNEKTVDGGKIKKPPESQNKPSGIDDEQPQQRRLSTPCLIPMDASGIGVSSS